VLVNVLEQTREDLGEAEEKLKSTEQTLQSVQSSLAEDQAALQEARGLLERYQPIIDVEGEASLKEEAAAALAEAKSKLADATRRAESTLQDAYGRAELIEKEARAKAEEIAGDAFLAQGRVKEYEKALQALKNAVDGYGDEYIKPSETVLDDLAEHFGFAEAGEKYKEAKARTKAMIKQGTAAECDYVEEYRRKTAVAFVIDAFNGKTDSTLARVKTDNLGKLQQEIEDAFALVNLNGQAFRNARITPAYRDARLEELRWAVALVVLREKEREEQRAIRERIREEEKARREYEKAMREAARDEERLQAAMEKARNELAKASEEQKAKYEAQLAALQEKLQEAEAKSQRAISMAQQTRSGHVYIISNVGSFGEDVFKIGMTRRLEPLDRVRELGDASVPFAFDVHAMIYSEDAPSLENALHKKFNDLRLNKVNPRKEFFRVSLGDIRAATQEMGLTAQFTMLAQAQEYRESLAMAKLPKEELERRMQGLLGRAENLEDE
jgi:chromosome segregation ATPase